MNTHPYAGGLPRAIKRFKTNGFLFVGDPQMSCVAPGRRLEDDFLTVTLDKLAQCRQLAEEGDLFVVFLGDMVENPDAKRAGTKRVVEDTNRMLTGYARAMHYRTAVTMPGNHDKAELRLRDGETLATMEALGLIHVIEPSGPFAIFDIDGVKVGLGGTPYGEDIPRDVRGVFGEDVDKVVWITHSQFQFDITNRYLPEVFEIKGCDMVVNGHDHTTQRPRVAGQTHWFNPGNITRLSVDMVDHVPSAWEWRPATPDGQLHQHVLRYNKAAFNLEGRQVAADAQGAVESEANRAKSLFAQLLSRDKDASSTELDRSASGDLIAEDIDRILTDNQRFGTGAQLAIRSLHLRAPERLK